MNQQTVQLIITAVIVAACALYVLRKVVFKKAPPRGSAPCAGGCDGCGTCGGCH